MTTRRRVGLTGALAATLAVLAWVLGGVSVGAKPAVAASSRPNIVFVLTDDLSWNLVTQRFMPHVVALERRGETFRNYFVADSLCCPSRASIFTGLFPDTTGVLVNTGGRHAGYHAFLIHHPNLETRTFAVATRQAGYRNSMMGKYLNGYGEPRMTTHIPPGWTDWHVAGNGYPEFNYALSEDGHVTHYGGPHNPRNYLTDVLSHRAISFVDSAARAHKPFLLEVATFAPHSPYTPAPRNAHDFPGLHAPRDPSFNAQNVRPPDWLGKRKPLTSRQLATLNKQFRKRAQSVEAVDRLLARIEATLRARGIARNTYIIFSSDNGYHMGQHRLLAGKETAFDSDIRVPLIVAGPGVPQGRTIWKVAQNVDLYPTFLQMAGVKPSVPIEGHSLMPLLHPSLGGPSLRWRTVAVVEHHGPDNKNDPDFENGALGGNPADYDAIRISNRQFGDVVYVEYKSGFDEYYNLASDPFEIHNTYATLSRHRQRQLHQMLIRLDSCHGAAACWAAADPQP